MQHTSPPVKKVTAKKPRRLKWILLITTLIIASPFLIHYGTTELHRWQMRSYLEDKYNEKFKIGSVVYSGGGFGVEGSWQSNDAHPESSDDTKFYIGCNSHGCSDTYMDAYFSKQEQEYLKLSMSSVGIGNYSARLIIPNKALQKVTKDTRLAEVKRNYDPVYKLRIEIDKVDDKNAMVDKLMAVLDNIYGFNLTKVEVEYKITDSRGVVYMCNTDYETTPKVDSNYLTRCLEGR